MLFSVLLATAFAALALASPIAAPYKWYHWRRPHHRHPHFTVSSFSSYPTGFPSGSPTGSPTNSTGLFAANSTGVFPTSFPTSIRSKCSEGLPTSLPVLSPVTSSMVFSTSSVAVSAVPTSTEASSTSATPTAIPTPTSSTISSALPTPTTTAANFFTRRPRPTTKSTPVQAPTTSVAPAPAPSSPGTSDGSPLSAGVSLLTTINKYRKLYNVNTLTWTAQLQANAQKTGDDDGGVNEVHELNPGSFAQVIAPGATVFPSSVDSKGDSPFEVTFAAWLCEVATDPELSQGGLNQCDLVQDILHIEYSGTGHHDILTSTSYKTIGCAFTQNPAAAKSSVYQGLWICDLGF